MKHFKKLLEQTQASQKKMHRLVADFKNSIGKMEADEETQAYFKKILADAMKGKAPDSTELENKIKDVTNGS